MTTSQTIADAVQSRSSEISYAMSGIVGGASFLSAEWLGVIIGALGVVATLGVNWHYKRKEDQRKHKEHLAAMRVSKAKAGHYSGGIDNDTTPPK